MLLLNMGCIDVGVHNMWMLWNVLFSYVRVLFRCDEWWTRKNEIIIFIIKTYVRHISNKKTNFSHKIYLLDKLLTSSCNNKNNSYCNKSVLCV